MSKNTYEDIENVLLKAEPDKKIPLLKHIFSKPENIDLFAYYFFPETITTSYNQWHLDMFEKMLNPEDYAEADPRGHGKSSNMMIVMAFLIVNKLDKYIVYISQSHAKTVQFIEPLRHEFRNNERLRQVYGDLNPKTGKDELGRDREDCIDIDDVRIEAVSFEKNLRGFKYGNSRPTLIILDDIEDDERVINPLLRDKDTNKLNRVIIPALDPVKGRIKMIGTILHHDSLLVKKIREYNGVIRRAIGDDGSILMPNLWNKERLMAKKKSMGSLAFEQEYQNNPIDDTKSIIKREWVKSCFDEDLSFQDRVKYNQKFLGVDFAFSDRVTADKSAFVGVGQVELCWDVFVCITKKGMSISEQFDYLEYLQGVEDFTDCALEENSIRSMSTELKSYKFPFTLFWTGSSDTAAKKQLDPDFEGKRHTVSKINMINRLATRFENNYESVRTNEGMTLRIPYKTENDKKIAHQILDECCTYARQDGKLVEVGVHGDIPIALAYGFERAELERFEFGAFMG